MKTFFLNKLLLIYLIVSSFNINIFSQNLVPNPSFENYTTCPNNSGQIFLATPWFQPLDINISTSDYYNYCNYISFGLGYKKPRTGNAFAGIDIGIDSNGYNEYIEIRLKDKLKLNYYYCISFFLTITSYANYTHDLFCACFTQDSLLSTIPGKLIKCPNSTICNLSGNIIIDTANWVPIKMLYNSNGQEQYLTIGNTKANATGNYFF